MKEVAGTGDESDAAQVASSAANIMHLEPATKQRLRKEVRGGD